MTQDSSQKGLSETKRALLEKRLSGQLSNVNAVKEIPKYEKQGSIPLSFAQERLWFLHQLDPQSPAYNMHDIVRLRGNLNKSILLRSFQTLFDRHDILRTSFQTEGDIPYQKIAAELQFEITESDLRSMAQPASESQIQELIQAEIRQPFDLTRSPLVRALLIQLSADDHILVLTIHHILFDEWSHEVFWQELSAIYQAYTAGEEPALPDLTLQYADFSIWQKRQIEKLMADQLSYWKKQLHGELPLIRLPADHLRPPQQSFRGALTWRKLPGSLYSQLKSLNQELGTTMFMSLLAAYQVLLSRYSGQSDILVGTPIANRSRAETKGLIGFFLNTLVMRADLSQDMEFADFALRTRQTALDAYTHQDLPFEKLVEELHPERDLSHNPIFQTMFVHQKSAHQAINLPGIVAESVPVDIGVAKFDLTLFVQESNGELSVGLEFSSDLFEESSAERILEHYQTLLESILKDPRQKISKLQLVPAAEREKILKEWNNTEIGSLPEICIHQLIEDQANQNSDLIAAADDLGSLTYRQLNAEANQLAHYLRAAGVGPDKPVGILLERSVDMIVSILAVLKAGGAYLPLDPTYPRERLVYMLEDAAAMVLITKEVFSGLIPEYNGFTCLIDSQWEVVSQENASNPVLLSSPDDLAYIIYTSGSTGKPRGVPITHRNLVHSTLAREYYYEHAVRSFLLLSSFTFDSSIAGIFWTLCSGGKLVLPPQRIEQDIPRLAEIITEHEISHTLCLPSLYSLMLELAEPGSLNSLTMVIVAGESCQPDLVQRHFSVLPQTALYNEYGPTETTVWSTVYKIPPGFEGLSVPIGHPIPNTKNYILDRHNQLAPIGIPGELCIGGAGLSSGYLNAPDLSEKRFVELPFENQPAARLYRTGDRARYLPDGNIEFLGRIDHQVKIRGNRVELGEIEGLLREMPEVKEAIVLVRGNQLTAYIIPEPALPQTNDWRSYLKKFLPDYMVPTSFLTLENFPLTPNGKIDRNALPDPASMDHKDAYISPSTATEQQLVEIWKEILDIDQVGIEDNFFDIGGNSLISIRIFARIAEHFDVKLPLSVLFTETTIKQLAERIEKEKGSHQAWSLLVPIQPEGDRPPFFCIHGLTGDVLWFRQLGQLMAPDQPFYGIQARGLDGDAPVIETIAEMASVYLEEMKRVQPEGPYYLGGASLGGTVALEMARQLEKRGEQVDLLVMFDHAPDLVAVDIEPNKSILNKGYQLISNSIRWFTGMRELGTGQIAPRAMRKIRVRLKGLNGKTAQGVSHNVDAADLLDYGAELPLYRQRMIESHWLAIKAYLAEPYDQPVLLLQAQTRPLLSTERPEDTWINLARGDLKIINIPGSHEGMFKEPHVKILARELCRQLDQAQASPRVK